MTSTIYCLIPVALLVIIFLLVRLILTRYKSPMKTKIVGAILVLSFLPAGIYYNNGMNDFHKNQSDYVNPALEWKKIDLLSESASSLEYRPEVGIFAKTDSGETQLTKPVPYCRVENQTLEILPEEIKITNTPFAELPAPPQSFKQQINFEIQYTVDNDTLAVSSFALLDSGEVWCTERVFRGPADFPTAVALGMGYLIVATAIFLGSLISLLILTMIVLEVYRRRKENKIE
jgi:energy-coupling factor transporter transmembrane protein EcfT